VSTTYIPGPGEDGYALRDEESAAEALGYPPEGREESDEEAERRYLEEHPEEHPEELEAFEAEAAWADQCIDAGCDRPWDAHTPEQKEQCSARAEYEALSDPHAEAEIHEEAAIGVPVHDRVEGLEQSREQLRQLLFPVAQQAGDPVPRRDAESREQWQTKAAEHGLTPEAVGELHAAASRRAAQAHEQEAER
jgi:hypothetical protein